ncbi:MAG: TAXI family TRAP transporter solute-binding subunit [Candidatus Binatia bacterium]
MNNIGKIAKWMIAVFLVVSVVAWCSPTRAQQAIRIGTSSIGSAFYTIAIGASEVIRKHSGLNTTVETVGGSSANMRGLGAKKIEFAMANAFAAFTSFKGTHNFKKPVNVRLVIQGQSSNRWLLLRKGAGIKRLQDLEGRTVIAKRRALPEIALVMNAFLKVFNLDKKKINIVATTNSRQAYKALRVGSVDAGVMPFSRKSAAVQKPMRDGVLEFFYTSKKKRDQMLNHLPPMMWGATFPGGTFEGQKKKLNLLGMNVYFMTRPDVSNETVYKVTKALLENTKEFATYHRAARLWTLKRAMRHVALPFHPGAIKYFKEKGVWTAEHEATQKKLLSR